jgi:hypothetical protein
MRSAYLARSLRWGDEPSGHYRVCLQPERDARSTINLKTRINMLMSEIFLRYAAPPGQRVHYLSNRRI